MNDMKVVVVSRETIKPSSPTPHHLRTFNISLLDQLAPAIYVPIILFYTFEGEDDKNNENIFRADQIKKSLSEILTRYYPLAGRINRDNSFVECNDDGVDYLEAKSNVVISQVIQHPDFNVLNKLLPCQSYGPGSEFGRLDYGFNSEVLLAVQINFFDCGGLAIGVCISHMMVDASSLITFINDWAAIARGATEEIKGPHFDSTFLFPQMDYSILTKDFKPYTGILSRDTDLVTKLFVFGAYSIAELKKRATNSNVLPEYLTRVKVLSTFMWWRFMNADQAKERAASASGKVYGVCYPVNIRPKMVPSLPTYSFGNLFGLTLAQSIFNAETTENYYQYRTLLGKVNESINKINSDYVREMQTTDAQLNSMKLISEGLLSDKVGFLAFSSWCRFPIYEANFGWGKPTWASSATIPLRNFIVFMNRRSGDGIEVWVNMTKEDMAAFKCDEELLKFVS